MKNLEKFVFNPKWDYVKFIANNVYQLGDILLDQKPELANEVNEGDVNLILEHIDQKDVFDIMVELYEQRLENEYF